MAKQFPINNLIYRVTIITDITRHATPDSANARWWEYLVLIILNEEKQIMKLEFGSSFY